MTSCFNLHSYFICKNHDASAELIDLYKSLSAVHKQIEYPRMMINFTQETEPLTSGSIEKEDCGSC